VIYARLAGLARRRRSDRRCVRPLVVIVLTAARDGALQRVILRPTTAQDRGYEERC